MATAGSSVGFLTLLARMTAEAIDSLGDLALFSSRSFGWLLRRRPRWGTILDSFYTVGVKSVLVVLLTGAFIGMVLAVQSYWTFNRMGLSSRLGAIINISVVRELGPVLAAVMIAGRVGSAMAAELGTMRITEQIDALACLGTNPLHYLVVPRLLACLLLIPLLTILADAAGIMGGALICLEVYRVEPHFYWLHAREFVTLGDVFYGAVKAVFFGIAIALISCHRGFKCEGGAEGVGRAATEAFVLSFIAILALDLFLSMGLDNLSSFLWPVKVRKLF